jgi:hypothetical protein
VRAGSKSGNVVIWQFIADEARTVSMRDSIASGMKNIQQ